jgi:hypothetical protein
MQPRNILVHVGVHGMEKCSRMNHGTLLLLQRDGVLPIFETWTPLARERSSHSRTVVAGSAK